MDSMEDKDWLFMSIAPAASWFTSLLTDHGIARRSLLFGGSSTKLL